MARLRRVAMTAADFDEDYFEHGVQLGKSLYDHYRWLGEPTIQLASRILGYLKIGRDDHILDYGCAKGYLIKAFRVLGYSAWGVDISPYAIDHADQDVRAYCWLVSGRPSMTIPRPVRSCLANKRRGRQRYCGMPRDYDAIIAKDVLEHLDEASVQGVLRRLRQASRQLFVIVPLGDGQRFVVPEYERDVTHRIRQPLEWWQRKLESSGWQVLEALYRLPGIKDDWAHHPRGNGFFICKRGRCPEHVRRS